MLIVWHKRKYTNPRESHSTFATLKHSGTPVLQAVLSDINCQQPSNNNGSKLTVGLNAPASVAAFAVVFIVVAVSVTAFVVLCISPIA